MRPLILLFLYACLIPSPLRADQPPPDISALEEQWHDTARQRDIPIKIDYPSFISSPLPVVLISHGLGGSRQGLAYIGQYWAAHGYIAIHLQHPGSDESLWHGTPATQMTKSMKSGETIEQFLARIRDVHFAIDELIRRNNDASWPLHGKLDVDHIAMAGHSFGALTTQAVCGQTLPSRRSMADPRIKLGIVFSPSPPAVGDPKTAFASITIPIFYWTGTKDEIPIVSNTKPQQRRIPFDSSNHPDQYLVILTDADHMIFNGRPIAEPLLHPHDSDWQRLIEVGSTAFLDKYLKNDKSQATYLDDGDFAKDVQPLGTFEKK